MPPNTIILITGANRGLGRAFLERYLARPNHTVIAANRNPDHPSSRDLHALPKAAGSVLHVVKVDSTSPTDAATAIAALRSEGITHVDTVYANAGIAYVMPRVSELRIPDLRAHMETNVYGIVRLYQAVLPLLRGSWRPTWVSVGGRSGCLNEFAAFPNAAFGVTKVALHWLTLAIHHEEARVVAFVVNPGWGARQAAEYFGKPELAESVLPIDVSVDGVLRLVDASTRDTHGGRFWTHEGEVVAW